MIKLSGSTEEEALLDAAMQVLAEKSLNGVRVHLVAERAGMVQSNLHYYYKTKHDLLVALYRRVHSRFEQTRKKVAKRSFPDLKSRLQVFFDQKKNIILNEPAIDYVQFDYWTQSRNDPEIREMIYASSETWRKEMRSAIRKYAPGVSEEDSRKLSHILVSMLMGASMQYLNHPGLMDLDEYFALCKEMLLTQIEKYERRGQALLEQQES